MTVVSCLIPLQILSLVKEKKKNPKFVTVGLILETTWAVACVLQLNILHRVNLQNYDEIIPNKKSIQKERRIIQLEIQAGLTISSSEERQDEASSCDKNSDRSLHRPQVQLGERRAGPGKTVALCASTAAREHPREHATSQLAKRGKDRALKPIIDVVM